MNFATNLKVLIILAQDLSLKNQCKQHTYLNFLLLIGMLCTAVMAVEKPGDDPLQWLRDSIPGEPGTDYPIYNAVESTAFSCEGRVFGGKSLLPFYNLQ